MKRTIQNILFAILVIILASCAGLGIGNKAQSEFEKGLSLFNKSKYIEAIPYFESATELDSDFYEAYLYLGRSYLNTGQYAKSLNPLRTAYNLSPEEARSEIKNILVDSLFNIATSSLKEGNLSNFNSNIAEILQLKENSRQAKTELANDLISFGLSELKEGNFSNSIETFKTALNLSPNSFDAYLGLANAYFKEGNVLKALTNARKALQINPDSQEALSIYNSFK